MFGAIGILLIVAGVLGYILYRRYTGTDAELAKQLARCTVKTFTPAGLTVYSPINPLTHTLEALDTAFSDSVAYYRQRYGFTKKLAAKNYSVYLFPDVTELHGIPVFKVHIAPGSDYDNSIYDQLPGEPGGFLYASELVINPKKCEIAIAESNSFETTAEAFRNGLEHVVLYHNDRKTYTATKVHLTGGHPLL